MISITKKQKDLIDSMNQYPSNISFISDVRFELSNENYNDHYSSSGIVVIESNYFYLKNYKNLLNKNIESKLDINNYKTLLLLNRALERHIYFNFYNITNFITYTENPY